MPSTKNFAWEWEDDGNVWRSYEESASDALESAFQSMISPCDLTIGGTSYQFSMDDCCFISICDPIFRVDLNSMTQTNSSSSYTRRVRRSFVGDIDEVWSWKGDRRWHSFSHSDCSFLSSAKSHGHSTLILHPAPSKSYSVDFSNMKQQNLSTRFNRDVKMQPSIPLPAPPMSAPKPSFKPSKSKKSKKGGISKKSSPFIPPS